MFGVMDKSAPVCNGHILAQIETPVTFLWYGVVAGDGHSYPPPAFTGRDGCSPARFFVSARNFCADFVILVKEAINVQGLQGLNAL